MIQVFDFFSGCGGTSCGFQKAGLDIVLGIDNDKSAAETFKINFPKANFICGDIRKIKEESLEKYINNKRPILFTGCAPCQPFSNQNRKKDINDERINLLNEFGRFIEYYKPDYIFVENVPGIQKVYSEKGPLDKFLKLLKELKYSHIETKVVSTDKYGVPQKRKRLVIIASLKHKLDFPDTICGKEKNDFSTVREWIYDLPPIKAGEVHYSDENHASANLSDLNLKRIRATPEGGSRKDWPNKLKLKCHENYSGHGDVYGRLCFDSLASSMTTKCTSYSNGRFGHPTQDRAISIREAACLQTFPRNFIFKGNFNEKAKQIGNAVPPLLAEVFGKMFKQSCFK